jgi:hypothetical protein
MDQLLIVVALLIVSGISSWLKKRAQAEEERNQGQPPVGAPQAPRPLRRPEQEMPTDWEEQTPPPVRRPQQNVPVDWEEELRRMLDMPSSQPAPPVVPPPPLVIVRPTPRPAPLIISEPPPIVEHQTGALEHAADSVRAARHLQETVLERIHRAGELRGAVTHAPLAVATARPISAIRKDFHGREDLRRAFVASLIFGPPKALDDGTASRI